MKKLITLFGLILGADANANLPDLTGNYTGCGVDGLIKPMNCK